VEVKCTALNCPNDLYQAQSPTIQRMFRMHKLELLRNAFSSHHRLVVIAHGRITRRPSFEGAAARLNDYTSLAYVTQTLTLRDGQTHVVTLFPRPSSTESETDECGPCASLEEEDGEDDTEGEAEAGANEH
jgi:hypothetical protein